MTTIEERLALKLWRTRRMRRWHVERPGIALPGIATMCGRQIPATPDLRGPRLPADVEWTDVCLTCLIAVEHE